jgi:hypothetical protein
MHARVGVATQYIRWLAARYLRNPRDPEELKRVVAAFKQIRPVDKRRNTVKRKRGLSRNTIRKWVRAPEATQPAYQRCATFNKLSPFHDTLEQALKADSFRAKHNRRSAKALFEQIKAEGYDGGYSQLTAFVRSWRGEQGKSLRAFVPLTFGTIAFGIGVRKVCWPDAYACANENVLVLA